jgi:hypothetical protein
MANRLTGCLNAFSVTFLYFANNHLMDFRDIFALIEKQWPLSTGSSTRSLILPMSILEHRQTSFT